MPTRIISCWMLMVLIIAGGCKDEQIDNNDLENYRPIYNVVQALGTLDATIMEYSRQGLTAKEALVKAAEDLENNELVASTKQFDSSYVYVYTKDGLETVYALIPTDATGNPILRGGGNNSGGNLKRLAGSVCANDIENRKILQFNAQFSTSYAAQQILNDKRAAYDLEVTTISDTFCTLDVLNTFKDYGLVVINTHGLPNGFMLGTSLPFSVRDSFKTFEAFAEQLNSNQDKRITDLLVLDLTLNIILKKNYNPTVPLHQQIFSDADEASTYVPAKVIAQLDLPNTVVFGNMCYSGYSNTASFSLTDIPILTAWEQTGVRSYFGYQQSSGISRTVHDEFASRMELNLYQGFFIEEDSTGNVHLSNNLDEYYDSVWVQINDEIHQRYGPLYLRQFYDDTYCYEDECADTLIDTRDGTKYPTVCIGNQVWMARDLKYDTGTNWCYDNNPSNCDSTGRLYNWQTASVACPAGWHLPTEPEWQTLVAELGGSLIAGGKMKDINGWNSPNTGATNSSGFTARASGWYNPTGGFGTYGVNLVYWSATEIDASTVSAIMLTNSSAGVSFTQFASKTSGYSCRCIQD